MTSRVRLRSLVDAVMTARGRIVSVKSSYMGKCGRRPEWLDLEATLDPSWPHSATDGGHGVIETHDVDIYVVRAWSKAWPSGVEHEYSSVGPLLPAPGVDTRVPIYREILEARLAAETVNAMPPGGVVLMDGSAVNAVRWWPWGGVSRPRSQHARTPARALEMLPKYRPWVEGVGEVDVEGFGEAVEKAAVLPVSTEVAWSIYTGRAAEVAGLEELDDWIMGLEVAEKLLAYKLLFETAWRSGVDVVFVAKTIRGRRFCGSTTPFSDVYHLERMTPRARGYVKPDEDWSISIGAASIVGVAQGNGKAMVGRKQRELEELRQALPGDLGLREFYAERIGVVETYARLSKNGPLILVGLVFDPTENPSWEDLVARLVEILGLLAGVSGREGYPLPLIRAHERAVVRRGDLVLVRKLLGLELERMSRSMLNM